MALQYLFPPTTQFQARTGANNTAGFLRVFYTQSDDDAAPTYSDFGGTLNAEEIVLDADGRAVVIVDDTKTYRLEIYNRNHGLLFTVDPLTAVGGGSGSSTVVQVISSDGTVAVESTSVGGVRYFDLSTAIDDTAPSKWGVHTGTATSVTGDGEWHELGNWVDIGTTSYYGGWKLFVKGGYDLAASLEMVSGDADALKTVDVMFVAEVDGVAQVTEYGSIDPSKGKDRVCFEWKGDGADGQMIDGRIFVRSSENVDISLVSRVLFNEECDGIVGNGAGGGDYIGGDYIDIVGTIINATGLQPVADMTAYQTTAGMTAYQQSGHYQTAGNYASATDLLNYQLTSEMSAYQTTAGMSSYLETSSFTGYTATALTAIENNITSIQNTITGIEQDISSIESAISGLTGTYVEQSAFTGYTASADSSFVHTGDMTAYQPSGDYVSSSELENYQTTAGMSAYATTGELAQKLDASASSSFQPSGDYVSSSELADYQTTAGMTGYATTGDLSAKLDASASSAFQPVSAMGDYQTTAGMSSYATTAELADYQTTAGMSAYQTTSGMSAYQPTSAMSAYMPTSSASAFMPATANPFTGVETDNTLTGNGLSSSVLGVNKMELGFDTATMVTSVSGNTATVGVNTGILSGYQTTADMTAYQPVGNYVSSSELADYQTTAGMSAYMPESSASAFMPATANPFTGVETDNSLTGNGLSGNELGVNGLELDFDTSIVSSLSGNTATVGVNPQILTSFITSTADCMPLSASSDFQQTSDMSAYMPVESASAFMPEESASAFMPATANPFTGVETDNSLTGDGLSSNPLGVNRMELVFDSSLSTSITGNTATVGINADILSGFITSTADCMPLASSSEFYSTSNPAGYITSVDLSPYAESSSLSAYQETAGMSAYQTVAGMSAYQPSGSYQTAGDYVSSSDMSAYQPTSSMGAYQETAGMSSYQTTADMSAYIPLSALGLVEI